MTSQPGHAANYSFLGSVEKYQLSNSGISLYCQDGYQLNVVFLSANMIRVFLIRPQYQEAPLDYPLATTEWPTVNFTFAEKPDEYILTSSELHLAIRKKPCRLKILDKSGFIINQDDGGMGIGWCGQEIRNWKALDPNEKFFGLGEKTGNLDKRGSEWVMWNTDDPHYNNLSDPLYQSIPFFIGMRDYRAYGIYFNNSYRSKFNFGAGTKRYFSFAADAGNLDYFFIHGPEVSTVVETYTELTGRTPVPPKWALGYQQCRWSYYPDKEVLRIAQTFREKQIPADVIYLDIHYMDGYRVFTWDKARFPDLAGLMAKLNELGFKVVVIIDPGVKADPDYRVAKEGLQQGHFVKYPDGQVYIGEVWPGESYFPDFSKEATRAWWGAQFKALLDAGVDGFWNDMNEPAVWGKAFPEEVLFHDEGRISSQKKLHNLYGFLMAKACYDGVLKHAPNSRPFVITRAGFAGEQRFTALWTGDNQANEEHLALGIRILLGLGISGIPFVGTDIGGFGGTPSGELYARWVQASLFAPFFRSHTHYGSSDQEPWSFGENIEEIVRQFITRRYELLPYIYSLFWESHTTGAPIMRPMFWHCQNDENVYDRKFQEQFFVGEKLLIAPVTKVGHYLQKVYLPAGKWLELNTEKVHDGNQTIVVDAPLTQLPIFLQSGVIIPSQEAEQFVDEKPVTKLSVDVFPAEQSGSYLFYEDDGISFDYEKGKYNLTEFKFITKNKKIEVEKKLVRHDFITHGRVLNFRFHAVSKPGKVVHENSELKIIDLQNSSSPGYYFDHEKNILVVRVADDAKNQKLLIHF